MVGSSSLFQKDAHENDKEAGHHKLEARKWNHFLFHPPGLTAYQFNFNLVPRADEIGAPSR